MNCWIAWLVQRFTSFDAANGFNQMLIEEDVVHRTAFTTRYGLYEYLVMLFGLCNAPSSFQRLMNSILQPLGWNFCMVYMDDILIFSSSPQEHAKHVRQVLELLRSHKIYLKPSKCKWFQTQVEFLGHVVSDQGIQVDKKKVQAIRDFPVPSGEKELMSFLGAAGFFRRFVRQFAHMTKPLTDLLKKDTPWVWGELQHTAFDSVKDALSTATVVQPPDPSKPFIVYTDASDFAVGAVVMQDHGSGPQPIAYMSRKHASAERNYPTREKELLAIVCALREWRHYFANTQISVFTDHDSLRYLLTQRLPLTGRMARWLEATQEFNLTIGYVPGKANVVADALSRVLLTSVQCASDDGSVRTVPASLRVPSHVSSLQQAHMSLAPWLPAAVKLAAISQTGAAAGLLSSIKLSYRNDAVAKVALQAIRNKQVSQFTLQQGLLYFKRGGDSSPRLYIPSGRNLRQLIISEQHDAGLSGHLGRDKTIERIKRLFYWPHIDEHVREYIATCPGCMASKPRNDRIPGLLQSLPIPSHAWENMSMDFIMELPKTAAGFNAILTCVDCLTKMVRLIPTTTDVDAVGTAKLVYSNVWSLFGAPKRIVSDRDPRFTSDFWRTLLQLIGTKLNMSTSFHPQTDGQTERVHRVIEEVLRQSINPEQSNWDDLLPVVEFAVNSAVHKSTGFSPFYVNYGREPETPASFLSGSHTTNKNIRSPSAVAEELTQVMSDALAKAKACIAKAQEQQQLYANRSRKEVSYTRGDMVLLSTSNLSRKTTEGVRKLDPLWVGPYKVTEQIGNVSYRLALPANLRIHDVIHVSQLKPFKESPDYPGRKSQSMHTFVPTGPEQQWFDVDSFVGMRTQNRVRQYRVRWVGYQPKDDTWHTATSLRRDLGSSTFNSLVEQFKMKSSCT